MHELAISSMLLTAAALVGSIVGAAKRPALAAMAGLGTLALVALLVAFRFPDPAG